MGAEKPIDLEICRRPIARKDLSATLSDPTWQACRMEMNRIGGAEREGLPANATWEQIEAAQEKKRFIRQAEREGFSADDAAFEEWKRGEVMKERRKQKDIQLHQSRKSR